MKGTTNIEFLVAAFVFLTTIAFIAFSIVINIPVLHGRAGSEGIKSLTYQLSEQLIFDKGLKESTITPLDDWSATDVSRAGLSSGKTYELSGKKVTELKTLCSTQNGYRKFAGMLDSSVDIKITLDFNGSENILCSPNSTSIVRNRFTILRPIVETFRGEGVMSVTVIK